MKKIALSFCLLTSMLIFVNEVNATPRPFYWKIRVGFLAKWQVTFGECDPSWGICLSLADGDSQDYLGFDNDTDEFILKFNKTSNGADNLATGTFELKEDSPVDPRVTKQFPNVIAKDKIYVLKKGSYKVVSDGGYYFVRFKYYIQ